MNTKEFNEIAKEMLVNGYGEKAFPPAILNRIWSMVSAISPGEFRFAIDSAMDEFGGRPPTPAGIRKQVLPAIRRYQEDARRAQIATLMADKGGCLYCGGSGWVNGRLRSNLSFEFSFLCSDCEAAKVRGYQPTRGCSWWRPELDAKYYRQNLTLKADLEFGEMQKLETCPSPG